jgi:ribonuclease Z
LKIQFLEIKIEFSRSDAFGRKNMSKRELIALGTSSQVPTRARSHNAYLLRWDGKGFLFDPGEGAQRQLTLAGVAACSIHYICITHFHGDHCLGLAGMAQRLSLDNCDHPVHIFFPEEGGIYVERLCAAAIYQTKIDLILHPTKQCGMTDLFETEEFVLKMHSLDHSVPTIGFRLQEPDGVRFDPEKLKPAGVYGPMVGELERKGVIEVENRIVRLEDVTVSRRGSAFAFIMDTRPCPGAVILAKDADLVVMEATFVSEDKEIADQYRHSTARDAAMTAASAGAHRLAITHFSQRYSNPEQHLADAREVFSNVIALNDFDRVPIPRRTG